MLFDNNISDSRHGYEVLPPAAGGDSPEQSSPRNSSFSHSSSNNISESDYSWMAQMYGIRFVPYTALSACCLLFNVLSLLAMSKIRGARTVHHVLLLNLAVCDLVGSVMLWMYYNSPVIFPRFSMRTIEHCLFIILVLAGPVILSLCSSLLSLLMLATNQYIAICYPFFSACKVTKGRVCICIGVAWCVSLILAILPALLMLFMMRLEHCTVFASILAQRSLEICTYCLAGMILIIVGLYARIYHEVLEYRRRTPQLTNRRPRAVSGCSSRGSHGGSGETETNYKAFITTFLLAGFLVIFWLPYMLYHSISAHVDIEYGPDYVWQIKFYVLDFLPMLNFLSDPIIYGIRMREIREGYRRLFAVCFPCCVREPRRMSRASVRFTTLETTTI